MAPPLNSRRVRDSDAAQLESTSASLLESQTHFISSARRCPLDELRRGVVSQEGWEKGTIKIPSASWRQVLKALADAYNARQAALFELAGHVHAALIEMVSSQGDVALSRSLAQILESAPECRNLLALATQLQAQELDAMLLRGDGALRHLVTEVPSGAAISPLTAKQVGEFSFDGARIEVDQGAKTVTWDAKGDVNAIQQARQHPLAQGLFDALAEVRWVRGSGGKIAGRMPQVHPFGAGASPDFAVARRYGPLGADLVSVRSIANRRLERQIRYARGLY